MTLQTALGNKVSLEDVKEAKANNTAADAVVTIAAVTDKRHQVHKVVWSYSGGTVTGGLTINDGATPYFDIDITATGPGSLDFSSVVGTVGNAVTVTLKNGGTGVVGKLFVEYETRP